MAELTEETVRRLNQLLEQNSRPNSRNRPGQNSEDTSFLKDLGKASVDSAADLMKFGGSVFASNARLSDSYAAATNVMGNFGSTLLDSNGVLGQAMGNVGSFGNAVIKAAESGVDTFRTLSSSGASFNNNILLMKNSAAQSRLTLDEFAGIISSNTQGLAAFGGTVTKGAQVFTDASQDLFDTGMATPLLNMGMTFEEVNEDLAEFIIRNRRRFTEEDIRNGKANASFLAMSTEMDKIAKLTGQNRKELEKEMNDRMRKGQVEAKIRMLEASGNTEAAEKMRLALAEASKAGPGALAAVEDLFTKGAVVSEEGRQAAVALGPAFNDLTNMVNVAKGPGGIDGMRSSIDSFNTAVSARINDPNFLQIATLGGMGNATADAAAGMIQAAGTYSDNVDALMREENLTREQAIQRLSELATSEQGARNPVTSTVINGEAALRDLGAIINDKLIGEDGAVTEFSSSLEGAANTLERLNRPQMQATIDGFLDNIASVTSVVTGSAGSITPDQDMTDVQVDPETQNKMLAVLNALKDNSDAQETEVKHLSAILSSSMGPDFMRTLEGLAEREGKDFETLVSEMAMGGSDTQFRDLASQIFQQQNPDATDADVGQFERNLDAALRVPIDSLLNDATMNVSIMRVTRLEDQNGQPIEGFSGGTIGVGNMIRDFGQQTQALLHGKEAVLTMEQLENIARGAPMMGLQTAVASLEPMMASAARSVSSSMNNVQPDQGPQVMQQSFSGLMQSLEKMGQDFRQSVESSGVQNQMQDLAEQLNSSMAPVVGELMKGNKVASRQLKSLGGLGGNLFRGLG